MEQSRHALGDVGVHVAVEEPSALVVGRHVDRHREARQHHHGVDPEAATH